MLMTNENSQSNLFSSTSIYSASRKYPQQSLFQNGIIYIYKYKCKYIYLQEAVLTDPSEYKYVMKKMSCFV